jgi:hypothetical protein
MPKLAAKALRLIAAHMVQEAEVLQRMARQALAEAKRLDSIPTTSREVRLPSTRTILGSVLIFAAAFAAYSILVVP